MSVVDSPCILWCFCYSTPSCVRQHLSKAGKRKTMSMFSRGFGLWTPGPWENNRNTWEYFRNGLGVWKSTVGCKLMIQSATPILDDARNAGLAPL